jgi:hypothetical protein
MQYEELMENVVKAFEVTGVVILAIGSIAALADATAALRRGSGGRLINVRVKELDDRSCSDWRSSSSPTSS